MPKHINTDAEESSRMWASASFVGVLIIIGVPLWWKTTEVYRVSLPYDKILAFDEQSHFITTKVTVLANDEATASEIAALIQKAYESSPILNFKITKRVLSDNLRNTLESVADEAEAAEEVALDVNATEHNTLFVVQRAPLYQHVWLSAERVVFFRDARAGPTLLKALDEWVYKWWLLEGAARGQYEGLRVRLPPAAGYHVMLSVVVPEPGQRVQFPAKDAMEDYIGSFVDELSVLYNFTLNSQWLYLLDYDFEAEEVKDNSDFGRHFAVPVEHLYPLLTMLEGRMGTHVASLPTINLVLYAVPCKKAPLRIYVDGVTVRTEMHGFMSPKWGGVALVNPAPAECARAAPVEPAVTPVMAMFLTHLRPLLGIPDTLEIAGAKMEPLRSVSPRRWEVDALLRLRTLEQLCSAEGTLQSLAQLLAEISNIVINDDVGASINAAVDGVNEATRLLAAGALVEAYSTSQRAFLAAEAAFSDPSLLALLYFPDDQKYAIYIPLFLPIMFPVVLSLKNLFLWMRGKPLHKEKTD